jgi:large subunit ribosomal protein L29
MAMANKTDYASKSADELTKSEGELRKQLFDLRFQHATRRLGNPMEIRQQKKELARLLTAKNAKG